VLLLQCCSVDLVVRRVLGEFGNAEKRRKRPIRTEAPSAELVAAGGVI
jgi:hypothetical protein